MSWRADLAERIRSAVPPDSTVVVYDAAPDQLELPAIVVTEGDPAVERLDSYCGRRYSFIVYVVSSRNEPIAQADQLDQLAEYVLGAIDDPKGIPYLWRSVSGILADDRSLSRSISVDLETELAVPPSPKQERN